MGQVVTQNGVTFFRYEPLYSFSYLLLKIEYTDSTFEYYRPISADTYGMLNNHEFYILDDQSSNTWYIDSGGYTIYYMGAEVYVPANVVSAYITDASAVYKDVIADKWYKPYVDYACTYEIFKGTGERAFEPDTYMNRTMFVQVLANLSGAVCDGSSDSKYADVPAGKWYTGAVKWASESGIVNGITPETFEPLSNITREQMCTMIVRFANHLDIELEKKSVRYPFRDGKQISAYAEDAVYLCQTSGLINGINDYDFAPKETASRAQASKILSLLCYEYLS